MSRSLGVLAALLLAWATLAAPAPEPFVAGWGNPVDPDRDCKLKRDNGTLTIEMPGNDHDYDPIRGRFNAPRLLRELQGNFDLQVRIRIDYRPSPSTVKEQPSYVSAGFLLLLPETCRVTCYRMEYAVSQRGSRPDAYTVPPTLAEPRREKVAPPGIEADSYAIMKNWYCKQRQFNMLWDRGLQQQFINEIWDYGWQDWPLQKKVDYAYLRLEQRDEWFNFFISPDGEKWTRLNYQPSLPTKSKVALAAFSTSAEPSKVRFDQLKLARGGKSKR